MNTTATAPVVHGAWDATALCTGTHGGSLASAQHNPDRITCPDCLAVLDDALVTRAALIHSLAGQLEISLPEAARRVTFTARELEYEAPNLYTAAQAAEIERCIVADVRAGK
ncbi:hypothetical protein HYQ03_gp36 [Arthrobacter phage Kuleana]|uniref:Uncharacterized protein n=1 Tax=Arthrobacter phage Kuleana TaxID=2653270 RepID=A0A5Q2WB36_9CAUD|nr:hypothetical protein HYQ03_gp36 [Arthrobacter phage Kuleana]QGH74523.1 hypothetical protein SEA_KULEANA_36 [Arthrobacter phage Kuleana]